MFYIKNHAAYSAACFERDKGQDNWDLCFSMDFDPHPYTYGKFSLRVVMDGVSSAHGGDAVRKAFPMLGNCLAGELATASLRLDTLVEEDKPEEIDRLLRKIVLRSFRQTDAFLGSSRCMTTLSVAILFQDWLFTANIGDSPIYLIDLDREPLQMESVFTCQTRAQQEIDAGRMTEEDALTSPLKNYVTGILGYVPSDGSSSDLLLDENFCWHRTELPLNGLLMMGSDGALSYLTRHRMAQLVADYLPSGLSSVREALREQVGQAGGEDDFTLILDEVRVQ